MQAPASRTLPLKPSRRLAAALLLAHLLAAAAVLLAALPGWVAALALVAVGASAARLRRPQAVAGLVLGGDGILLTVGADGTAQAAEVDPQTLVLAWIVVLVYRQQGGRHALCLPGDGMDAADARELRVWLRWRVGGGAG